MAYKKIKVPVDGEKITTNADLSLNVPNHPIIPFIEGDGIGMDVTPVMKKVVEAAVNLAYGTQRSITWMEVFAGEKAIRQYGPGVWIPDETLEAIREFNVSIKGPLSTPEYCGIRSLNVELRQALDLFTCIRPIRYFQGVPSPVVNPQKTNMVIFRENSEDLYSGIEWEADSPEVKKVIQFLKEEMGVDNIRFDQGCGIGIKPVSKEGTQRLVRKAIQYAIDHDLPSVTLVHKGNIMKFTEGAFKQWGYELAIERFGAWKNEGEEHYVLQNPKTGREMIIKDVIADSFLQQTLILPEEYSVIATLNLNGDYIADALAAEVGGIGLAPGANMGGSVAFFESTHGSAPKLAGLGTANPGSLILAAEMMLRHIRWTEAADLIIRGVQGAVMEKTVTFDLQALLPEATLLSTSEFGDAVIEKMAA